MNVYKYTFQCDCLVDGKTIAYQIEIQTHGQLMAEDIIAFKINGPSIQESIANEYYKMFGGKQTITGIHSGVTITTHRGEL